MATLSMSQAFASINMSETSHKEGFTSEEYILSLLTQGATQRSLALISKEIISIQKQLSTVSKCLQAITKFGGPFTVQDLYPYWLALSQVDKMRTAIKDIVGGNTDVCKWLDQETNLAEEEELEQLMIEMLYSEDVEEDNDEDADEVESNYEAFSWS